MSTQAQINEIARDMLPAKDPRQRVLVLKAFSKAVDNPSVPAGSLWKEFFTQCADDIAYFNRIKNQPHEQEH